LSMVQLPADVAKPNRNRLVEAPLVLLSLPPRVPPVPCLPSELSPPLRFLAARISETVKVPSFAKVRNAMPCSRLPLMMQSQVNELPFDGSSETAATQASL